MSNSIEETETKVFDDEQETELRCYECSQLFIYSTHLSVHMQTEHGRDDAFQCPTCFHTFKQLSSLSLHVNSKHRVNQDISCPDCPKSFISTGHFRSHMKNVHNKENIFPCPHCTNFYKEKRFVNLHVRRVHENVRPFICDLCPKSFQNSGNLQRHVNDIHKKARNFLCQECPKDFTQKKSLDFHIRKAHTLERPFKCDQCSLSFASNHTMKRHIIGKHTVSEKNFMCHQCPAKFVAQSTLSTHLENKRCGRKVGAPRKNPTDKRSTKKRIRSAKSNKAKICPKTDQQENASLPDDLNPPSPEMIIVGVTPKEEYLECADTSCFIRQDRVGESDNFESVEVTISEMVISQMDFSLKDRIFQIFKGQMKSGIVTLIRNKVLTHSDLTSIVLLAEEAHLKTVELIEAIIANITNQ